MRLRVVYISQWVAGVTCNHVTLIWLLLLMILSLIIEELGERRKLNCGTVSKHVQAKRGEGVHGSGDTSCWAWKMSQTARAIVWPPGSQRLLVIRFEVLYSPDWWKKQLWCLVWGVLVGSCCAIYLCVYLMPVYMLHIGRCLWYCPRLLSVANRNHLFMTQWATGSSVGLFISK